jgi:hypothetical protein
VVALQRLPALDRSANEARLARNLIWPADVRVLELPMAGLAFALVVETVAERARQGWILEDLLSLVERLPLLIRSFLVVRRWAIRRDRLVGPVPGLPLGWQHLLLIEVEANSGRCRVLATAAQPAELAPALAQLAAQMAQLYDGNHETCVRWRQSGNKKGAPLFAAALEQSALLQELEEGWSPTLYSWGIRGFFELCLALTSEGLLDVADQIKGVNEAARRFELPPAERFGREGKRLSEFQVRLK